MVFENLTCEHFCWCFTSFVVPQVFKSITKIKTWGYREGTPKTFNKLLVLVPWKVVPLYVNQYTDLIWNLWFYLSTHEWVPKCLFA